MTSEAGTPEMAAAEEEFDWAHFSQSLIAYVYLELNRQAAAETYPDVAFQILTSVECQAAYQHELRRQSLAQVDAAAIKQIQALLPRLQQPAAPVTPAPDWLERTVEHGRAWLEAGTERWRQVQLSLAGLQFGPAGQLATTGLMSEDQPTAARAEGALQVAPPEASFELTLVVLPDRTAAEPNLYQAEVMLTLLDRFGDYAGIDLYLFWDGTTQQATTDQLGRALFTALPQTQIKAMSLIVILPD